VRDKRFAFVLLLTLLASCERKDAIPTAPTDPSPTAPVCEAHPLGDYCSRTACPGYDAAVVAARAFPARSFCFVGVIGLCGPWRFVSTGDGYTSRTLFFDDGGATVAVETTTDAFVPGDPCKSATYYGFIPGCRREEKENLCPH
jgi:hypothetical protein